MPLPHALIIRNKVDAYARARKAAGDSRPLGVLRAEALVMFVEGYGHDTRNAPWAEPGRSVELRICATPETTLGLADTPGDLPGVGPIPADLIRAMARRAKLRWLTHCATTGALLDLDTKTYRPAAWQNRHTQARWVTSAGPHSTVPAEATDTDHVVRWPDGPTSVRNLISLDRGWHNAKTHNALIATPLPNGSIRWTSPLGQTHIVSPYDYRLGP